MEETISDITGIDVAVLRDSTQMPFVPVAKRMYWALKRRTKRTEDMAYCLFGIFNVNLPLIYGEGSKAFLRLQDAISRDTDDLTLFAWCKNNDDGDALHSQICHGIYASSPSNFQCGKDIVRFHPSRLPNGHSFMATNQGMNFNTKLCHDTKGEYYLLNLYCRYENATLVEWSADSLAIRLIKTPRGYARGQPRTFDIIKETFRAPSWLDTAAPVKVPKQLSRLESLQSLNHAFQFHVLCPEEISMDIGASKQQEWDQLRQRLLTGSSTKFLGMIVGELTVHALDVYHKDYNSRIPKKSESEKRVQMWKGFKVPREWIILCGLRLCETNAAKLEPWASIFVNGKYGNEALDGSSFLETYEKKLQDYDVKAITVDQLQAIFWGEANKILSKGKKLPTQVKLTPQVQPKMDGCIPELDKRGVRLIKENTLKASLSLNSVEQNGMTTHNVEVKVQFFYS